MTASLLDFCSDCSSELSWESITVPVMASTATASAAADSRWAGTAFCLGRTLSSPRTAATNRST